MSDVLIVDDSPADRTLFRTLLQRHGFHVTELAYGREVIAKARELRPHVIILDVNLPDIDGNQVCREIRADPACTGIPVLMLTVRDREADILRGLEAGADDYVPKDAAPEIFLARVRHLANYRQLAATAVLNEQMAQIGRLLAGIVHEIRGPLGVIRSHAEVLEIKAAAEPSLKTFTAPILRGCQLLQVRLEHLMAAVRGGPSQSRGMDIAPLVREVASIFEKGLDPRHAPVKVAIDLSAQTPVVLGDPGRLMQVLLNLLANAYDAILAHSASGGTILVKAQVADDFLEIDVADDGPGIAPAHLGRIFEPFYTTKTGGSGFGLYLAAQMIHEQGGSLQARNRDEGGACFTIRLPLGARNGPEGQTPNDDDDDD